MHLYAIVSLAVVGVVLGAPNHLKHVTIEKQGFPEKPVQGGRAKAVVNGASGNLGASASWGPFSAGASLGDAGASAGAQAGSAGAGAGIGGGSTATASASAGASVGGAAGGAGGPTIFDQIFNIPISVLKAVNEHVNNKEVVPGAHMAHRRLRKCRRHGICPDEGVTIQGSAGAGGAGAQAGAGAYANAGADTGVYSKNAGADASASAGAQAGSGSTLTVRKNYDNVFAIPISALTSVNQLLNGKK